MSGSRQPRHDAVDDDDEGRRGGDGGRPLRQDDQDGGRGTDPGRWTAASGRGYDSSGGGTSPGAQAPGVNYGVAMPRYGTSRFRHQPVPSASWPYSGRQVPPPRLSSPQFDAKLEHTYHAYYIFGITRTYFNVRSLRFKKHDFLRFD